MEKNKLYQKNQKIHDDDDNINYDSSDRENNSSFIIDSPKSKNTSLKIKKYQNNVIKNNDEQQEQQIIQKKKNRIYDDNLEDDDEYDNKMLLPYPSPKEIKNKNILSLSIDDNNINIKNDNDINNNINDDNLLSPQNNKQFERRRKFCEIMYFCYKKEACFFISFFISTLIFFIIVSDIVLIQRPYYSDFFYTDDIQELEHPYIYINQPSSRITTKIAFGSCSTHDLTKPLNIFNDIIDYSPDAWIWLGDSVYFGNPDNMMECIDKYNNNDKTSIPNYLCDCNGLSPLNSTSDYFHCNAGIFSHIENLSLRMRSHIDYSYFLNFMCEDNKKSWRRFDREHFIKCFRPILGIYDDNDFGGGFSDLYPFEYNSIHIKEHYKQLYLNFIGEHPDSERRDKLRGGAFQRYKLGSNIKQSVDVFLLDTYYDRQNLPCNVAYNLFCSEKNIINNDDLSIQKCNAQIKDCCITDQIIQEGWCLFIKNNGKQKYNFAYESDNFILKYGLFFDRMCIPEHPYYGIYLPSNWRSIINKFINENFNYVLNTFNNPNEILSHKNGSLFIPEKIKTPFCDILGPLQRDWLIDEFLFVQNKDIITDDNLKRKNNDINSIHSQKYDSKEAIYKKTSPITLFISSSVVLNNPNSLNECNGSDWDCYKYALRSLLSIITENVPLKKTCPVIITGDYHYHDLKYVDEDTALVYYKNYMKWPLLQVLSSGMSESTLFSSGKNNKNSYPTDFFRNTTLYPFLENESEEESHVLSNKNPDNSNLINLVKKNHIKKKTYDYMGSRVGKASGNPGFGKMDIDWNNKHVTFSIHNLPNSHVTIDFNTCKRS